MIQTFRAAAEKVSAIVAEVETMDEALAYAVALCERKEACQLLISGCESQLSEPAGDLCDRKQQKIIAAPLLPEEQTQSLAALCRERGIVFLRDGMRSQLAGVDIGFTFADLALAETGTLVLDCPSEELRLATMICEYHVCHAAKSRDSSPTRWQAQKRNSGRLWARLELYRFYHRASRTADIERVLTLGVHGPLELHILLLENK